ncbi:MAG: TIGR04086 family membrane protein [Clostridia bacterium]|nr:TIGR04086 family membrane protein [Clostridia bacterium]
MRKDSFQGSYGEDTNGYGNGVIEGIKAVALALALSLIGAVIFAGILRAATLGNAVIYPVNQIIKVLSIVAGVTVFVRGEKGWLKGGAAALGFTALSYLAFSALGGDFSLSWLIFAELLWTAGAGVLSGMIAVNLRR